jgi:glycosyltransferase involved in cell wall biosynthesis
LQREASPFSRGALEERLLKSAALGVYDFDDALQWDERGVLIEVLRNRHRKTIRCISAADRVIAGNEVLADFASSFSKDVVIIPSCVNQRRYTNKASFELHDPPLLGWIGTPGGEKYVLGIATALMEMNRRTGARLQVVSGRKSSLGALEGIVDRFTWTEAISERIMSTWDVGIMPIEDRPFERGKCGYKLLQYAASGLPAIASPVGVNEAICQNLGFLPASSQSDWVEAFMTVVDAPNKVREEIGRKAHDGVVRMFSFDAWKDQWLVAVGATLPRTSSS